MPAVATCHNHKLPYCSRLNSVNNLIGKLKHLLVGKTTHDFTLFKLCRGLALLGHLYDFREILGFPINPIWNMLNTGESNLSSCKHPVFIALFWWNKTVCCHKDWTVECLKLFILLPPCISIVSNEMVILLKGWIVVSRQHLSMCININPRPFRLLEQLLHVLQIVPGNQYTRVIPHS